MISANELEKLKDLHQEHIANTFVFTSKVLDQVRGIGAAQAEVLHDLLQNGAASVGSPVNAAQDPNAMVQDAMQELSRRTAEQAERSGDFVNQAASAYAEIMRLVMAYTAGTFSTMQEASRVAVPSNSWTEALGNPWLQNVVGAFKDAADRMNSGAEPVQTKTKSSPASASSRPAQAKSSPASASSQPAQAKSSPASASSMKAQAKSSPASASSKPAQAKSSPASASSMKAQAKSSPASASSKPAQAKSSPASASSQPAQAKSSPASASSMPAEPKSSSTTPARK